MWRDYWRRWFVRWREAIWNLRKDAIALILAVLVLILQFKMGWIKQGTGWQATFLNIGPTLGILVLFLGYHALAAIVLVDRDRSGAIQSLDSALASLCDEWPERVSRLGMLYGALTEGERLLEKYRAKDPSLDTLLKNWDDCVPKLLNSQFGPNYRKAFYEGAKGQPCHLPKQREDYEQWIRDRNNRLRSFIDEFEERPPQLESYRRNRHPDH